jgi:hypothetical protein
LVDSSGAQVTVEDGRFWPLGLATDLKGRPRSWEDFARRERATDVTVAVTSPEASPAAVFDLARGLLGDTAPRRRETFADGVAVHNVLANFGDHGDQLWVAVVGADDGAALRVPGGPAGSVYVFVDAFGPPRHEWMAAFGAELVAALRSKGLVFTWRAPYDGRWRDSPGGLTHLRRDGVRMACRLVAWLASPGRRRAAPAARPSTDVHHI